MKTFFLERVFDFSFLRSSDFILTYLSYGDEEDAFGYDQRVCTGAASCVT